MPAVAYRYFGAMHQSLSLQYAPCDCEACQEARLASPPPAPLPSRGEKDLTKVAHRAFDYLHKKGTYKPEDLTKYKAYRDLITATAEVFNTAIPHEVPEEMRAYLERDVFIFSGLKTHTQLTEARSKLKDEQGNVRPYYQFEEEILKLNNTYNRNYLEAEYQFAVQSAQSAANWANLQTDTSRYWLEYRTAGDERVRQSHAALAGICLPKDDAFWTEYYPPNGWRCRCTAVEVLARENTKSNPETAKKAGEAATTQIGKSGKNKLEMFRFNPGQVQKIFPPNNTYTQVVGAKDVWQALKRILQRRRSELRDVADLNDFFKGFARDNSEMFARGFEEITITTRSGVNGFTNANGKISLKEDITRKCIEAINNVKKGVATTLSQEIALSTLHHEIWHNANKIGLVRMSTFQERTMELANEFVARKTLPQFLERLGGELQNRELMNDRDNTGYNRMVRNYNQLIKWSGANESEVLNTVREHLINGRYDEQMKGLSKAIANHSTNNTDEITATELIVEAQGLSEREFKNLLSMYGR